jgi:putative spermidine/putrescine transport system ATP-binding protein
MTTSSAVTSAIAAPSAPAPLEGHGVVLAGLVRRFGDVTALAGLNLTLAPGELVALLGPSGCGKTTALRVLAGFETPDAGIVRVSGVDVTRQPPNRRGMGMVFQAFSLFPNLTVADNVGFGLRVRGANAAARRTRAGELLELVGLSATADRYPHQISGGQQQRVALARALAIEPRVLLLDEPLSALDAQVRNQLRDEIRRLQQRLHITTLFVTHDQGEALSIADRVGVMRAGVLEQIATPDEIYHRPTTAFVGEFVGTMNRIPGRMVDSETVEVLGLRRPVAASESPRVAGEEVTVLVRPEAITVTADDHARDLVLVRTFHGALTRVSVRLVGGDEVRADLPSPAATLLHPGVTVAVSLGDSPVLVA